MVGGKKKLHRGEGIEIERMREKERARGRIVWDVDKRGKRKR